MLKMIKMSLALPLTGFLLAGCVGVETEGSSDSSAPVETESAIPGPTLPPEASEQSESGAQAFQNHVLQVIAYSYTNVDPSPVQAISDMESCLRCRFISEEIEGAAQENDTFSGDAITSSASRLIRTQADLGFGHVLTIDVPAGQRLAQDGSVIAKREALAGQSLLMSVFWQEDHWVLKELTPMQEFGGGQAYTFALEPDSQEFFIDMFAEPKPDSEVGIFNG